MLQDPTMASNISANSTAFPPGSGGGYAPPDFGSLVISCLFYVVIALFAIFGNLLVVISFFLNDKLRTVTNYFVIGLAVADIMVGALSVPLWMYFINSFPRTEKEVTSLYLALDAFAGISSILQLMAISLERYFCVGWAVKHRNMPKYVYYVALGLVWLVSAIAAAITRLNLLTQADLSLFVGVIFFLLPLVVIILSYAAIWNIAITRMSNNPSKRSLKREIRTAVTIAFVIGFFVLTWTPFFVNLIIYSYCGPACPFSWSLTLFFKFLHYSNSAVNPIVYGVRIPEFRKTFKFILRRIYGPIISLCRR